jgi:Reverse transcriptase (RNA-dependent DNA polymerase)
LKTRHLRLLCKEEKKLVEEYVKKWLNEKKIGPSKASFASPLLLVKRKNKETRICVDYRQINSITTTDSYSLPLMDQLISTNTEAKYYSTIDLNAAYNQIRVRKSDKKFTTFQTPLGNYEYLVMPLGLCNASSMFQH